MEIGCYGHRQQRQIGINRHYHHPISSGGAALAVDSRKSGSQQQFFPVGSSHSHNRSCLPWQPKHPLQSQKPNSSYLMATRLETDPHRSSRGSHNNSYEDITAGDHHHYHREPHNSDDEFFPSAQTTISPSFTRNAAVVFSRPQTVTGPLSWDWRNRKSAPAPAAVLRNEMIDASAASARYGKRKQESPVTLYYETSAAAASGNTTMASADRTGRISVAAAAGKRAWSPLKTITTSTTGTAILPKKTTWLGSKPATAVDYGENNNGGSTLAQVHSTGSSLSSAHEDAAGIGKPWAAFPLPRLNSPSDLQSGTEEIVPLIVSPASDNLMFDYANNLDDPGNQLHHHDFQIRSSLPPQLTRKQYKEILSRQQRSKS